MATVTIDEMQALVGAEFVGDWVEVTQAMIDRFADATGDRQFIHVDPVRAAATPFGGTIAHGFLTLSLLPMLTGSITGAPRLAGVKMAVNYGSNRLRFLSPVRSGSRVRIRTKLLSLIEKSPCVFQQVSDVTIEIEGSEKPALAAEWITQLHT